MKRFLIIVIYIVSTTFSFSQNETMLELQRMFFQYRNADSIPADTLFSIAKKIRARVKMDDSIENVQKIKKLEILNPPVKVTPIELPKETVDTIVQKDSIISKPKITRKQTLANLTFQERLFYVSKLDFNFVDSLERTGLKDKDRTWILENFEENDLSRIKVVWGYAIYKNDFDFLISKSLNMYEKICKIEEAVYDPKREIVMKCLFLADSSGNRIITRREFIMFNKQLTALNSNSQPIVFDQVITKKIDTVKIVSKVKPIQKLQLNLKFEEQFFRTINFSQATLDSIEASGFSPTDRNIKIQVATKLDNVSHLFITVVWGYAYKTKDFNFYIPIAMNDYRQIAKKIGKGVNEETNFTSMKILFLADTSADRIVTRTELMEVTKKIAALTTKLLKDDTLIYQRIRVPSDVDVQEIIVDNKSVIETLAGGFKTSNSLRLHIDRRILEVKKMESIDMLNQSEYNNVIKKFCYKADIIRDRVLNEEEVKNGLIYMEEIISE